MTLNIILARVYRDAEVDGANGCSPTAISRRMVGRYPDLTEIPPSDVTGCDGAGGKTGGMATSTKWSPCILTLEANKC